MRLLIAAAMLMLWALPASAADSMVAPLDTLTFQYGISPDSSFTGISDAKICITNTGAQADSNFGGDASNIQIGCTATLKCRFVTRLTPGNYLPTGFVVVKAEMVISNGPAGAADTLLGGVGLVPIEFGTGDGVGGQAADTIGVTWDSWYAQPTGTDSTWSLPGADSSNTVVLMDTLGVDDTVRLAIPWGGSQVAYRLRDQYDRGVITFGGNFDRSPHWTTVGTYSGAGVKTFDITEMATFAFPPDGSSPPPNYCWIFRDYKEAFGASERMTFAPTEAGGTTTVLFRLIGYDPRARGPMGNGAQGFGQ